MKYVSTRGLGPVLNFEEVVLTGLASDGGLYVPESLPRFSPEKIKSWVGLSYTELAFEIMSPFVDGEIPDNDLRQLISKAYTSFRHQAIAPLVQVNQNHWVLELFHGPTLAFKDFALQFLGLLLDYFLVKRQQKVVVLGATSGDTGSAAIEGCRHCKNLDVFILHPNERVSEVQRRQMTTVIADNVHNIALQGNFDDCQNLVKASFADQSFLPEGRQLVAVNSINWARIMAQIVYYFYSALALGGPLRPINYSVPTGNFGDIFAGYLAKQMGLPIQQLVIATNTNDILHRCLTNNDYSKKELFHSLSPSMDIMISSNFERLMFDLYDRQGASIRQLMDGFKSGSLTLSEQAIEKAQTLFSSHRLNDEDTVSAIRQLYETTGYLADPHTIIGIEAAKHSIKDQSLPMVSLATAHPAKFPEAISKTGLTVKPVLPMHLQDLFGKEERYQVLPNQKSDIQRYILEKIAV